MIMIWMYTFCFCFLVSATAVERNDAFLVSLRTVCFFVGLQLATLLYIACAGDVRRVLGLVHYFVMTGQMDGRMRQYHTVLPMTISPTTVPP